MKKFVPHGIGKSLKKQLLSHSVRRNGSFELYNQTVFTPIDSVIFQRILVEGSFEPEISAAMSALATPETTVFDVGANIGVMTVNLLAARSDVNVVAVECSPSTISYLRCTHDISQHKDRWRIIEAAVANHEGQVDFYTSGPALGAYDGIIDTGRGGDAKKVSVPARRLDSIWHELGDPDVSLMKLDIEGGEWDALQGAQELVEACKPHIIFEWNPINLSAYGRRTEDIFRIFSTEYDLFSLPFLNRLEPSILKLETMRTEMFLLAPKSRKNDALPDPR